MMAIAEPMNFVRLLKIRNDVVRDKRLLCLNAQVDDVITADIVTRQGKIERRPVCRDPITGRYYIGESL